MSLPQQRRIGDIRSSYVCYCLDSNKPHYIHDDFLTCEYKVITCTREPSFWWRIKSWKCPFLSFQAGRYIRKLKLFIAFHCRDFYVLIWASPSQRILTVSECSDRSEITAILLLLENRRSYNSPLSFFVIRNLNNLCLIISFRPTISIQSCPRWAHNPRNSFKLYFLHFSLLWMELGMEHKRLALFTELVRDKARRI